MTDSLFFEFVLLTGQASFRFACLASGCRCGTMSQDKTQCFLCGNRTTKRRWKIQLSRTISTGCLTSPHEFQTITLALTLLRKRKQEMFDRFFFFSDLLEAVAIYDTACCLPVADYNNCNGWQANDNVKKIIYRHLKCFFLISYKAQNVF